MTFVRLSQRHVGGVFRRVVRKVNGDPIRTLEFRRGKALDLKGNDLKAVHNDLGKALDELAQDENGKLRPVDRSEATGEDHVRNAAAGEPVTEPAGAASE